MEHSTPIMPPPAASAGLMMPTASPIMPISASVPDFGSVMHQNTPPELYPGQHQKPELYPGQFQKPPSNINSTVLSEPPAVAMPDEPLYHWYYKVLEKSYNFVNRPAYIETEGTEQITET